jgi:hypothetical protein
VQQGFTAKYRSIHIQGHETIMELNQQSLNQQSLNQQSWVLRNHLGEFLKELASVDRRWIRIDSCSNDACFPNGGTEEFAFPLESFCDLLGVSAEKANDYLCAAKLMKSHCLHKTMGPVKNNWESLITEFGLDMQMIRATNRKFLGDGVHVIRIGCLGKKNKNTAFSALQQATRFFVGENPEQNGGFKKGWKPESIRATPQSNELLSKMSSDLTVFMVKQQKELDEKERKKELDEKERKKEGLDGDGDDKSRDDKIGNEKIGDDESKIDESFPSKSPAKSRSSVEFDMKDVKTEPIRWQSPNGRTQTAVHIPRSATKISFRKSAGITGWIEQVVASMFDKAKVPEEVGVEWLIEAIYFRYRPQFDAFCVRKGYSLPVTLKERKQMARKKAKLKRELEKDKDETIVTGNEAAMRDSLAGSQSLT